MDARHYLVAAIGLLIFAKGVWSVLGPSSMKRMAQGCLNLSAKLGRLFGVLYIAAGVALWIVVLLGQQIVDWILLAIGVLAVLGGFLYFRPERVQAVARTVLIDREDAFVRLLGILTILLAAALMWIGIRGWGF